MKKFFMTPGPSELYFTAEEHVKKALQDKIGSISHRSAHFQDIYRHTVEQLRQLFSLPDDYHIFFTSSATEIWERSIQNLVSNESYHLVNGAFSRRFMEISSELGRKTLSSEVADGEVVDVGRLLVPETTEMICFTHNETSTGAMQPLEDIYTIRDAFPDTLISADIVSSAPDVAMDFQKIDMAYFSVQKCFGLPAGLGVWLLNGRCLARAAALEKQGLRTGTYHSISSLLHKSGVFQTPETPNVMNIYLLGKVAEDMNTKGIVQIRRETTYKAAVLYQAIGENPSLRPFVKNPDHQSRTVIVAECLDGDNTRFLEKLAKKGFVAGKGYGVHKSNHLRIANFPTHSKEQIEMIADLLAEN